MRLHALLVLGFAASIFGCAAKEQTTPGQPAEAESAVTAVGPDATPVPTGDWRNAAFLDHMHAHAEHLDDLNFALGDDDLGMAMTPAYWLSRHEAVGGLPEELQPFLVRMREAARAVEAAQDIETARAAAKRIGAECQGCHNAAGVVTQ